VQNASVVLENIAEYDILHALRLSSAKYKLMPHLQKYFHGV